MRPLAIPPALPLVALVAAAALAGCDTGDDSVRLCRDSLGRRTADAACEQRRGGASYVYLRDNNRLPRQGEAFSNYAAYPGDGVVRSPEGRVIRGGLGMSARGGAGE